MVDPNWITGFTDGEGCFSIFVHKDKHKRKNGNTVTYYRWNAVFNFGLRGDDNKVPRLFKEYFKVGHVNEQKAEIETGHLHNYGKTYYDIRNTKELVEVIIPHFDKYPLQSKKRDDYILWKEAVFILHKYRLNPTLFSKITISPDDKKRLMEIHIAMRKRVTGSRRTWEYKNLDKDGSIENIALEGQLELI